MGQPTAEQIAQRAFNLGLLDERQLQEVWASLGSRNVSSKDLVQLLVRREYMTNYQVDRLVKGERSGFFFGKYKVLYLVGSGTFARVYRAMDRETGKVVAIKVLRSRFSENPVQYGQFLREGKLGCALRHPNIVPIYDVGSDGKSHFLVMEFVEGRNLREFVKVRKKLDPLEATRLTSDIAQGLKYGFEHALTHRDLKMSNVLVSSRGQAKLVDFGLASLDETLTDENVSDWSNIRTIDYAALERATGVRKDDTRSDIYFLGCIYYHMLTGEPPLPETRDRLQRLSKTRFLEVVPIRKLDPSVPHSVALVVNKCMALDPTRRYQSPAAVLADLELTIKRLESGSEPGGRDAPPDDLPFSEPAAGSTAGTSLTAPQQQLAIMVVESDAKMQDIFREGFRRAGYRVLLTSDPERALGRFRQDAATADCVLLNAQQLGESALEAFNQFGSDNRTDFIPVVLLLDESQRGWQSRAQVAPRRIVLSMPLTMKQLRAALTKLTTPDA